MRSKVVNCNNICRINNCICSGQCDIEGFKKIDLSKSGLMIYHHSDEINSTEMLTRTPESKDNNESFILENNGDFNIFPTDLIPETDLNNIKCMRCRRIIEHFLQLLPKIPPISVNNIKGICDRCINMIDKENICFTCEKTVQKFIKLKNKKLEKRKNNIKQWLDKVNKLLKIAFILKQENKYPHISHTYSELHLDDLKKKIKAHMTYENYSLLNYLKYKRSPEKLIQIYNDSSQTPIKTNEELNNEPFKIDEDTTEMILPHIEESTLLYTGNIRVSALRRYCSVDSIFTTISDATKGTHMGSDFMYFFPKEMVDSSPQQFSSSDLIKETKYLLSIRDMTKASRIIVEKKKQTIKEKKVIKKIKEPIHDEQSKQIDNNDDSVEVETIFRKKKTTEKKTSEKKTTEKKQIPSEKKKVHKSDVKEKSPKDEKRPLKKDEDRKFPKKDTKQKITVDKETQKTATPSEKDSSRNTDTDKPVEDIKKHKTTSVTDFYMNVQRISPPKKEEIKRMSDPKPDKNTKFVKKLEKPVDLLTYEKYIDQYDSLNYDDVGKDCPLCADSSVNLKKKSKKKEIDEIRKEVKNRDTIIGQEIVRSEPQLRSEINEDIRTKPQLFQTTYCVIEQPVSFEKDKIEKSNKVAKQDKTIQDKEATKGIIHYALSNPTYIEKGWTMLPTQKIVKKMNIYRMEPSHPEFDWFKHNKSKGQMSYDSGEILADFDDNGCGRWYYRNGRLALHYYEALEKNAHQRIVVYSNGEPDERGRSRPYSVLAMFDFSGNGVVFDHAGKIRLKYNQSEGIVLDRTIGPNTQWKWHSLNDPPLLQKVMLDTQLPHKDENILKLGLADRRQTIMHQPVNQEDMLAIEFDNFIREKKEKLKQAFKPFQIQMKAIKLNENFSLKIMDQASISLVFRDGKTHLKLNVGMVLDPKEIVDTEIEELGEVSNSLERFPARTKSIKDLQKNIDRARTIELKKIEHERRLIRPESQLSVDRMTAPASRPLRPQFHASCASCKCPRKPSSCNIYYDTRLF